MSKIRDRGAMLTDRDAAEKLHVKTVTLAQWRWLRRGPPFVKLGRRIYYYENDLEAFIARQRRVPRAA